MILINGVPFKFVNSTDDINMAMLRPKTQTISIDFDSYLPETLESTVIHELVHAADEQFKLELGEAGVRILEAFLFQTLSTAGVDFSPLLKRITEDINGP